MAEASLEGADPRSWHAVTVALFLVALVAGFAQFGAVASLADQPFVALPDRA